MKIVRGLAVANGIGFGGVYKDEEDVWVSKFHFLWEDGEVAAALAESVEEKGLGCYETSPPKAIVHVRADKLDALVAALASHETRCVHCQARRRWAASQDDAEDDWCDPPSIEFEHGHLF